MHSAFDRHAKRYAETWAADPVAAQMRTVVRRALLARLPARSRVLDAGCGIGLDAAWLHKAGHQVVAIDASAGMVAEAARRLPDLSIHHLAVEEAADLPGTFQAALLNFGVINCVDLPRAAAALAACLSTGAPLVVVPMPRINPQWTLRRVRHGHFGDAARRLRRTLDVDVDGVPVQTRYLSGGDVRRGLFPWFQLEAQQSLGLLLPAPGAETDPAQLARRAAWEARLRHLPLLRTVGDHLLMVFRRGAPPRPKPAGPLRRRLQTRKAQRTGQVQRLRVLVLELTRGCQSRCAGCNFRGPAGGEALTPEQCGALAAAAKARGCQEILLTGGEPLLRPDFQDIVQAIHRSHVPITLLTNGLSLARHAAVVAKRCARVIVSLDGYDPASYQKTRGVDGFNAVARGVNALHDQNPGLPVHARVTVSGLNAGRLVDIAQAAKAMGVAGISYLAADVDSEEAFGRGAPRPLPIPDPDALRIELEALRNRLPDGFLMDSPTALARIWQKFAADHGRMPHQPPRCDAPWTSTVVGSDLKLRPCFFLPATASAERGLDAGLAALSPQLQRLEVRTHPTCARCVCWARLT